MLICADYTVDSGKSLRFYSGDFPIIINSDNITEMYVAAGDCFSNGESYFFAVAHTKNGNLYRISDIYKISEDYTKCLSAKNPRECAVEDLFDILKDLHDGKTYCRKVFLDDGNDQNTAKKEGRQKC